MAMTFHISPWRSMIAGEEESSDQKTSWLDGMARKTERNVREECMFTRLFFRWMVLQEARKGSVRWRWYGKIPNSKHQMPDKYKIQNSKSIVISPDRLIVLSPDSFVQPSNCQLSNYPASCITHRYFLLLSHPFHPKRSS